VQEGTAAALARHWEQGWNGLDLETIMAPFADDVTFSSPFVSRFTGDPAVTHVTGYAAVRDYMATALERAGDVRYTLDDVYQGTDMVILVYRFQRPGQPERAGADSMRLDTVDKVVEWRSCYPFAPDEIPPRA
jgi:ketosteroid isomerase-like protein